MKLVKEFLANRVHWRSERSFIVVTAGAVIGIMNFWQFPQLVNQYGGFAFVLLYMLCLFLIAMPVMAGLMVLGRRGKCNTVSAMRRLVFEEDAKSSWVWVAWWGVFTLLLIGSFYSVVSSISLGYTFRFVASQFTTPQLLDHLFQWPGVLTHAKEFVIWNTLFLVIAVWVVIRGIRHGLETISYIAVTGMFVILLMMVGVAMMQPSFFRSLHVLFAVDWHALSWTSVVVAMTYAFLTLGIGAGIMVVYGSYLPLHADLGRSVLWVVVLDVVASLLACLAISPVLLSHAGAAGHMGLNALYSTLPGELIPFQHYQVEGFLLYAVIFLAALTTMIAILETLVIVLIEVYDMSRLVAAPIVGMVLWGLGLLSIFSFNLWQHVHLFGYWTPFEAMVKLSTDYMLPLGALFFSLFVGWCLNTRVAEVELNQISTTRLQATEIQNHSTNVPKRLVPIKRPSGVKSKATRAEPKTAQKGQPSRKR